MTPTPTSGAHNEAFRDSVQRLGDTLRRRFELIEGRVSAGSDLALAGLAEEIPNGFVATVVTIADQSTIVPEAQRSGMNGGVGNSEVFAIGVWTGVTLGVDGPFATTGVLALGIRYHGFRVGRRLTAFSSKGAIVRGAGP